MSKPKIVVVALLALIAWTTVLISGALYGWWRSPLAPAGDSQAFFRAAVAKLKIENKGNAALVLIDDGKILGEHYSTTNDAVNGNTVFATASLSKWIAAWGVMKLVEDGKLDLDTPVNDYLKRWQLPPSQFDNRGVTVRRLLSHTAGLNDGLGFGDYEASETIPTLVASLTHPRASSNEPVVIAVGQQPGTWDYSGGGYLILELLVEDVSGESFDAFMRRSVFEPLGMNRSGYAYLGDIDNSARSYDVDGKQVAPYRYACKAATAFATSANDLAKFALAQLPTVKDKPLTQATIDAMRKPHGKLFGIELSGLGTVLYAPTATGNFVFGHDGANEPAINSAVRINPDTGDAIVVLATGGKPLASILGSQWVYSQIGLPDVMSIPTELQRIVPALLIGSLVIVVVAILFGRRKSAAARIS